MLVRTRDCIVSPKLYKQSEISAKVSVVLRHRFDLYSQNCSSFVCIFATCVSDLGLADRLGHFEALSFVSDRSSSCLAFIDLTLCRKVYKTM